MLIKNCWSPGKHWKSRAQIHSQPDGSRSDEQRVAPGGHLPPPGLLSGQCEKEEGRHSGRQPAADCE